MPEIKKTITPDSKKEKTSKFKIEQEKSLSSSEFLKEGTNTPYFKSRLHELAFYFSTNNPQFDTLLGIKPIHKINHEKARDLRKIYLHIFHPEKNIISDSDLDFKKISMEINAVFHRVTGGIL